LDFVRPYFVEKDKKEKEVKKRVILRKQPNWVVRVYDPTIYSDDGKDIITAPPLIPPYSNMHLLRLISDYKKYEESRKNVCEALSSVEYEKNLQTIEYSFKLSHGQQPKFQNVFCKKEYNPIAHHILTCQYASRKLVVCDKKETP
jgi:hypothetical protein